MIPGDTSVVDEFLVTKVTQGDHFVLVKVDQVVRLIGVALLINAHLLHSRRLKPFGFKQGLNFVLGVVVESEKHELLGSDVARREGEVVYILSLQDRQNGSVSCDVSRE